jgi:hypothetical protein
MGVIALRPEQYAVHSASVEHISVSVNHVEFVIHTSGRPPSQWSVTTVADVTGIIAAMMISDITR